MTPRLIISRSIIFTNGEPFARFDSTLAACRFLASCGWRMVARVGAVMMFEQRQ